ncbi:MAG: hypothetical protein IJ659_06405, partial [Alloprevotella sp.]|nr:hypothetical protein [Alloprevotella sp.]
SRLPNFIVEFDPQKKHFLHHINNKCSKGKYLSAFPKISPLKMTNKPKAWNPLLPVPHLEALALPV